MAIRVNRVMLVSLWAETIKKNVFEAYRILELAVDGKSISYQVCPVICITGEGRAEFEGRGVLICVLVAQ